MFPQTWCSVVDLDDLGTAAGPRDSAAPGSWEYARLLIRLHGVPIGFLTLPLLQGQVDAAAILEGVDRELISSVNEHLVADGERPVASSKALSGVGAGCARRVGDEDLTVVVCTRERPELLRRCLNGLRRLTHPRLQIIVVDNAPTTDATLEAFEESVGTDRRFRYVREPRPGLSCARNRGLAEARSDLVAFTDDDVEVDPGWAGVVAASFDRPEVACVTGLVCTAAISSPAEAYFDARVSWGDSCRRYTFRAGDEEDPLFPYSPGRFGTGANVAFRRSVILDELGGFDEALGAGTLTGGGEDLDAFVRVLLAGYALTYEPSALVWHSHRADLPALRRQMFAYGIGLSAFVSKHLAARSTRGEVVRRVPAAVRHAAALAVGTRRALREEESSRGARGASIDVSENAIAAHPLLLRELAGAAIGPVMLVRARRRVPHRWSPR